MMKISVCLITWNEESLLAKAIGSTEGLADEVIVVDTGSTDRTVELAQELGARVFTGADRMHKAESRNRAQDEAGGDWVVILDADEQIADPVGLRAFLETTDADAVYIKLAFMDAQDRPTLSYQQMRCWRRGAYRYKYRAHELPVPADGWGKLGHTDFVWEHRPPRGRAWKLEYTLQRLLLDVEENPEASRPLYYLGRQYMYMKEWQKALDTLKQYLTKPGVDAADAWQNIATCKAKLGDEKGQIQALHRACATLPGRREWWCELAGIYYRKQQYQMAAGLLKCALEIPMPATSYVGHYWYGAGLYDLLARALWKLKRYQEGHKYALLAVESSPDNQRLWDNLAWFEGKLGLAPDQYMDMVPNVAQGLKVLMLAFEDHSGKAYACMEAFNAHNGQGGRARLVTWQESYLRYKRDIFQPSEDQMRLLVEWADVIHVFDQYPWNVVRWGKPLVVTYSGTHYRDHRRWFNQTDQQAGTVQLCSTLDLTEHGPRWCPRPIGQIDAKPGPSEPFVVSHAPTRRNENKGTEEVIRQLSGLDGVELDVIERVSNAECLKRKARSHLYIDQFLMGYGTNALEAWAMGIPVVAGAHPELRERIQAEVGFLPFVETQIEDLRATVERLRDDPEFYEEARAKGQRYVREFHAPERVTAQLIAAYQEALERGVPGEVAIIDYDLLLQAAAMDAFYKRHGPLVHTKQIRHQVIAGMVEGDGVLDVGCGTGDLLLLLQGNGHGRLVGTDVSSVALAMAKERGVEADLIQTGHIPDGPFSTIVISQVLEHVVNDQSFIHAAAEQLDPGGLLIASVPAVGTSGRHHRRQYTTDSFADLLREVGDVTAHSWRDPHRYLMTARKAP